MHSETKSSELIGWYGKIPSSGDYIYRRLPDSLVNWWANWFQTSMLSWQNNKQALANTFISAPIWNFAIPATLGTQYVQIGCLLPATDKVGRLYPICAFRYYKLEEWHPHQLDASSSWFSMLGQVLHQGIRHSYATEQLDRNLLAIPPLTPPFPKESEILSVIGLYDPSAPRLSWNQVSERFNAEQYTSFWWTNQADGRAHATCGHSGNLTPQLFSQLFNLKPQQNQTNGSALYPQMFD